MNPTRSIRRLCVLIGAGVMSIGIAQAFTDNFDAYQPGTTIIGQGGWMGWDNNPAYDATVMSGGLSAPSRVLITGSSDIVKLASLETSIRPLNTVRTKVFMPSTSIGDTYFILLNRYQHAGPYSWSVQLRMNASQGVIQENRAGSGPSLPLVTNAWKEIRCEIDIANNVVEVFYDGQHLVTQPWKIPGDPNAQDKLVAVDLYSDNPGSVAYYDDLRTDPGGPTLIFGNFHERLGSATLDIEDQPDGLRLLIDNLLHPGDGVKVLLDEEADEFGMEWDPINDALAQPGDVMEILHFGLPEGSVVATEIGKLRVSKGADKQIEYRNTYGAAAFRVEAYLDDARVAQSLAGPGDLVANVPNWPVHYKPRSRRRCCVDKDRASTAIVKFVDDEGDPHDIGDVWIGLGREGIPGDGAQAVRLPNGLVVLANSIRVVPDNPNSEPGFTLRTVLLRDELVPLRRLRRQTRGDFGVTIETPDATTIIKKKKSPPPKEVQVRSSFGNNPNNICLVVNSGPGSGIVFDLQEPSNPSATASLRASFMGTANGTHLGTKVKDMLMLRTAGGWDLFADFSEMGSPTARATGTLNGAVVFDIVVPNGLIGRTNRLALPDAIMDPSRSEVRTMIIGGTPYVIDRLFVTPGEGTIDDIHEVMLHGMEMDLTIRDIHSYQYGLARLELELEGCPDPTGQALTVVFRHPHTREILHTENVVLDGQGRAEFRVPDFSYIGEDVEVLIEAPSKYLRKKKTVNHGRTGHLVEALVRTGDIDGDNEVAIGDYALLSAAFGSTPGVPTYNSDADLDCDEEIGIGDFALLSQNFGLTGDE